MSENNEDTATRHSLTVAVQSVLWNASNYPEPAQSRILGQDVRPLVEKVVDALMPPLEPTPVTDEQVERMCVVMHDSYEAAAQAEGWETQERSRKPWSEVPEANKRTMRVAVLAVLEAAQEAVR